MMQEEARRCCFSFSHGGGARRALLGRLLKRLERARSGGAVRAPVLRLAGFPAFSLPRRLQRQSGSQAASQKAL
jgi:hypothetical protein